MLNLFNRQKKTDASFSVDENGQTHLALTLPTAWERLSQEQLNYICVLMANGVQMQELKHYCFLHFAGFRVVSRWGDNWIIRIRQGWFKKRDFFFSAEELARITMRYLGWMDVQPTALIRLVRHKKFHAVNAQLHGITFNVFLSLENLWQGYIYTKDNKLVDRMVRMLYRDNKGNPIDVIPEKIRVSAILWFGAFKTFCYEHWPNLYSHSVSSDGSSSGPVDVESITNMQIRALTGGDITKEKEVLAMDVWRALTELDAKAADAKEQRRQIDSIKHKR